MSLVVVLADPIQITVIILIYGGLYGRTTNNAQEFRVR